MAWLAREEAAGRSSIEALGFRARLLPEDHYRGPALTFGAGGYGMSVLYSIVRVIQVLAALLAADPYRPLARAQTARAH